MKKPKKQKKQPISVKMSPDNIAHVKAQAKLLERSVSWVVNDIVGKSRLS